MTWSRSWQVLVQRTDAQGACRCILQCFNPRRTDVQGACICQCILQTIARHSEGVCTQSRPGNIYCVLCCGQILCVV